ncbi:N-acetylglucosamine-1-phosphodiester alpha-N-acetylglucosaminidase isoform X1 [Ahaetulla prasina]|uniref:N-acetylglucosamine-1-phosphodiester alpha-N-acetylglucosaminidase isoform X1 n=1 Tax=Ahaetulla prasina TaxID=499056 RepID=UPI002647819F|nr:N-acetylglucosamine-1-phosphodiester alpha-N-acetylglucosaminidase isoform X1 [Ahaetulla prasina]
MNCLSHVPGRGLAGFALAAVFGGLFHCFWGVHGSAGAWNSLNDDLLLPYLPPQHGPRHHHRYIRDCQALLHGNATHETWPSDNSSAFPLAITYTFVSDFPPHHPNRRQVYGHLTIVRDPLRTFSVLEPGGPGGCQLHRRATVEETVSQSQCLVAQNGGYFDTKTGACLGNVVSNGQLVQSSGVQNAQFGIRKDGTLVFGYLSEEEVLATDNPFVQLVSGVGWLLRDGEVYVNQSQVAECDKTQETGTFDTFVNMVSARTAVGHDRQGQLVLFHADGQSSIRGLNLWEMAEFLKERGVVNAINLDGGGSATFVVNGSLASYPSDHCVFDSTWRCPRSISTVLCVHEAACRPQNCSGHGHCVRGQCLCHGAFWSGPACDMLDCGPSNCTLHGMCTEVGCVCDAGWTGENCTQACTNGTYGDSCAQKCLCRNNGKCDPVHGSCTCPVGFQGIFCEEACPLGRFGPNCQHRCQCPNQCYCDRMTGSCNISLDSTILDKLSRAGPCLLQATSKEEFLFSKKAWVAISLGLLVLLLLSVLVNVRLALRDTNKRRERGQYISVPLEEINGGIKDRDLAAAWEADDPTEAAWDTNPTERVHLL